MVNTKTILMISVVAVIVINSVLVGAGKATDERKKNLYQRASVHTDTLKGKKQLFIDDDDGTMSQSITEQVTEITKIILEQTMKNKQFTNYLESIFKNLKHYADGQIKSREQKLEEVYEKWEQANFPDPVKKEKAKKLLQKRKIEKDLQEKEEKKRETKRENSDLKKKK